MFFLDLLFQLIILEIHVLIRFFDIDLLLGELVYLFLNQLGHNVHFFRTHGTLRFMARVLHNRLRWLSVKCKMRSFCQGCLWLLNADHVAKIWVIHRGYPSEILQVLWHCRLNANIMSRFSLELQLFDMIESALSLINRNISLVFQLVYLRVQGLLLSGCISLLSLQLQDILVFLIDLVQQVISLTELLNLLNDVLLDWIIIQTDFSDSFVVF